LDTIESRLDLVLQRLPRPLADMSDPLVALEHAVETLQEVRPVLEDLPQPLDDMSGRLVALEHAVETLKEVWPELEDLQH
jgi:hypothetical protein